MAEFPHRQSAHCESGVAANLLCREGLAVSEAMVFGIGAGLFFAYLPFIRINGMPLVTYRAAAGHLLRRIARIPGLRLERRTFRNREKAMAGLDRLLDAGIPVGVQTGVFWLPYFPRALRFHFNAHNLVVYGRENGDYLISDPVFPEPVRCAAADLVRARFAAGPLAPRGAMYWLAGVPESLGMAPLVRDGIARVCRMMLGSPFPLIGVRGIRFLAARLERWPHRLGEQRALLHLGHVVRMQEEIGTGGGGFRFMYAAFLQESGELLGEELLIDCSRRLARAGDAWRHFALGAARICKRRPRKEDTWADLADRLRDCARQEEDIFGELRTWSRKR